MTQHKNDMYGNIEARDEADAGVQAPIPAATVVLIRDSAQDEPQVLMLRKNSKITFGGMWVFPGGKIDDADAHPSADSELTARNAAARETEEEAGLAVRPEEFVHFAHWTPPPGPQKRFATWFFIAKVADAQEVVIDQGEIHEHDWISPAGALARHAAGEIDLVPPTWVTLYYLSRRASADQALKDLAAQQPRVYATRVVKAQSGHRVALWEGDAGYAEWEADVSGPRHRLTMAPGGFEFEHSEIDY